MMCLMTLTQLGFVGLITLHVLWKVTHTSKALFIMGEAAAHSASALANRALPIHEPTKPSLGLSLRKALEIIQPLNCTVGLPAFPRSFSSSMGSEEKGCELPLLMHRDCDSLRDSGAVHEPEDGSVSRNLLSDVLGSDSPAHESSSEFSIFPSLSEINDINSNES